MKEYCSFCEEYQFISADNKCKRCGTECNNADVDDSFMEVLEEIYEF